MDARQIISRLNLAPHPEGGHFRETYRDPAKTGGRSVGTAIFFLLASTTYIETPHVLMILVTTSDGCTLLCGAPVNISGKTASQGTGDDTSARLCSESPSCFKLFEHCSFLADSLADCTAGSSKGLSDA